MIRAGIVVTGTEVLTGRVTDRNGPWLAEQLRRLGIDIAEVITVGDRPDDLVGALRFLINAGVELIVTSGGLGPTADDLTAAVVASVQGREMVLDESWRAHISAIVERMGRNRGWSAPADAIAAGVAKQATVPVGSEVLAPTGTAPGFVVPAAAGDGPPVVVLPGPPRELQAMWPAALETTAVRGVVSQAGELRQSTLRLSNTLEAELAATLRERADLADPLEITTCLRDAEVEIVTRYAAGQQEAYDRFAAMIASVYGPRLFSPDGRTVDDIVAAALVERGLTVATCESCTGGKVAARLTDRPGSSAYVLGGLVTYSNEAKTALAGVPAELIKEHGAVSAQVALAMAQGVRESLGADVGISTTGVAGPGGGTPDKPVGLVHLCLVGPDGMLERRIQLPGTRPDVRERTVSIAMHLLRELLG